MQRKGGDLWRYFFFCERGRKGLNMFPVIFNVFFSEFRLCVRVHVFWFEACCSSTCCPPHAHTTPLKSNDRPASKSQPRTCSTHSQSIQNFDQQSHAKHRQNDNNQTNNDENRTHARARTMMNGLCVTRLFGRSWTGFKNKTHSFLERLTKISSGYKK